MSNELYQNCSNCGNEHHIEDHCDVCLTEAKELQRCLTVIKNLENYCLEKSVNSTDKLTRNLATLQAETLATAHRALISTKKYK
jgi:hypothetical protein